MKRLVRNRESAQASRQRKRDKLQELEAKVTKLEGEKGELKRYALTLETDNRRLREQLQQLASVRQFGDNQQGQWQQCGQQSDSSPELSLQFGEKQQQHQSHHKHAPLVNDKTKKVALMILCFTFGIWMKSQMPVTNVPAYPKYVREPIPEVIPESLANARSNMVAVQQPHQPQSTQAAAQAQAVHVGRDLKQFAIDQKATRSTVPSANTTFENVTPSEFVNSSASVQMDNADESPLTQYLSYKSNDHPNTAIMTCSNLRQIVPSNQAPLNSNEPLYISLVVPPTSKAGSHPNALGENSTTFTEITCRVESVKTVTLGLDSIIPTADV